ncbi:MAG TPA: hypothetical protein VGJ95_16565 [Pseudonocardiaceae bacterium]|jgi:hypothetical protein
MPPTARQAKKGIRNYLVAVTGLRPADGVTIRSATIAPEEFNDTLVILGDVIAPQAQAGLARRAENATVTCWVIVTKPGSDETAIDTAGDRADALIALVSNALAADRTAGGSVPNPGRIDLATSGLEETPVTWENQAARRATIPFSLSWTSHIS